MSVPLQHPVKCVQVRELLPPPGEAAVLTHLAQAHTAGPAQIPPGPWFRVQTQPCLLAPCSISLNRGYYCCGDMGTICYVHSLTTEACALTGMRVGRSGRGHCLLGSPTEVRTEATECRRGHTAVPSLFGGSSPLCLPLTWAQTWEGARAGVAQWTECRPANRKVASLMPSQSTGLGCGPGPLLGGMREATTR